MPKFILREDSFKGPMPVEVELCLCGDESVSIEMYYTGTSNTIGHFTGDGRLRLHSLNKEWAKRAGIRVSVDGRILLAKGE